MQSLFNELSDNSAESKQETVNGSFEVSGIVLIGNSSIASSVTYVDNNQETPVQTLPSVDSNSHISDKGDQKMNGVNRDNKENKRKSLKGDDGVNKKASELDSQNADDLQTTKDEEMETKRQEELLAKIPEEWRVMRTAMKTEIEQLKADLKDNFKSEMRKVKEEQRKINTEMEKVKKEQMDSGIEQVKQRNNIEVCCKEIATLKGMISRQDHIIRECKDKILQLQKEKGENVLRISGLKEEEKEDPKTVVKNFFKNKMKIEEEISISDAHRVGKGEDRVMLVYLRIVAKKGLIFKHLKNIVKIKNYADKPYQVQEQILQREFEEMKRKR